jgi:hypothetical protein
MLMAMGAAISGRFQISSEGAVVAPFDKKVEKVFLYAAVSDDHSVFAVDCKAQLCKCQVLTDAGTNLIHQRKVAFNDLAVSGLY